VADEAGPDGAEDVNDEAVEAGGGENDEESEAECVNVEVRRGAAADD
jgi:hypothetical protein